SHSSSLTCQAVGIFREHVFCVPPQRRLREQELRKLQNERRHQQERRGNEQTKGRASPRGAVKGEERKQQRDTEECGSEVEQTVSQQRQGRAPQKGTQSAAESRA